MMLEAGRAADTGDMPSLLERPPAVPPSAPATAGRRLLTAFQAFEDFPALRRARDEMVAAIPEASTNPARLINAVESDPALTIAVLRAGARSSRGNKPVDVPAALALLTPDQLELTVLDIGTYDFFEQSRVWSDAADRFRVHPRATHAPFE